MLFEEAALGVIDVENEAESQPHLRIRHEALEMTARRTRSEADGGVLDR